jgi:putative endonuclease
MTNKTHTVLYTGVTTNLRARVYEHRTGDVGYFTKKYRCHKLVYYAQHADVRHAIAQEKQIKAGSRADKKRLIEDMNPEWHDLAAELGWLDEEIASSALPPRNDGREPPQQETVSSPGPPRNDGGGEVSS